MIKKYEGYALSVVIRDSIRQKSTLMTAAELRGNFNEYMRVSKITLSEVMVGGYQKDEFIIRTDR